MRRFKTMESALLKIQSYAMKGTYTIRLLEDYTLSDLDINALRNFKKNGVSFV